MPTTVAMTTSQVVIPTVAPSRHRPYKRLQRQSIREQHRERTTSGPSAIAGLNVEDSASNNITLGNMGGLGLTYSVTY